MSGPTSPGAARRTPLVIGLGNENRGDDGCGLAVVRALRERLGEDERLVEGPEDVTELLALWAGSERVIVVDAVRSGHAPGTVHRLDLAHQELPGPWRATSTHGLTFADALALARTLGRIPASLTFYGIEAGSVGMQRGLSGPVAGAVTAVTEAVLAEIGRAPAARAANRR